MQPTFLGLSGTTLTTDERALFKAHPPAGFILFKRNVVDRAQVKALTDDLRTLSGRSDVPILIDQEGGRVARMQPPEWPAFPTGAAFEALYEKAPMSAIEAVRVNAQALGLMLAEVGINVDCLPLLDVRQPGAHDIIGDRAFGEEPLRVAAMGRSVLEGLALAGCVGVIKHIPGHGRSMADSHLELPVVTASVEELEVDLQPFITMSQAPLAHTPMAMTAHVVYTAWDDRNCATLSPTIISDVIRGRIGFDGLLMSDDLGMKALSGSFAARARGVIEAGCDIILHCSGNFSEMEQVCSAAGSISDKGLSRLNKAMGVTQTKVDLPHFADLTKKRDALLALV